MTETTIDPLAALRKRIDDWFAKAEDGTLEVVWTLNPDLDQELADRLAKQADNTGTAPP